MIYLFEILIEKALKGQKFENKYSIKYFIEYFLSPRINQQKVSYNKRELFALSVVPAADTQASHPMCFLKKHGSTTRAVHHVAGVLVVAGEVVRVVYVEITD